MSLLNVSRLHDWKLIQVANELPNRFGLVELVIDEELDLRAPNEAASYFGDCAGKAIFIPIEPEYDSTDQPILTETIDHDDQGDVFILRSCNG